MVVSSELKLYKGNGGDYLGGYLNGFYITKDHLEKKAEQPESGTISAAFFRLHYKYE